MMTAPRLRQRSGIGAPSRVRERTMARSLETVVQIEAKPEAVFARLDDHTRLATHMERPSAMMGGGQMTYAFDAAGGKAVGSHIVMGGSAFGLSLYVDEVVTQREQPRRKAWKTVGQTRLIVMDAYEMGFEIEPVGSGSRLRLWIAYELPSKGLGRWLGPFLAPMFARWCVGRMAGDAARHFSSANRRSVIRSSHSVEGSGPINRRLQ